jgi:hypothetical protein
MEVYNVKGFKFLKLLPGQTDAHVAEGTNNRHQQLHK